MSIAVGQRQEFLVPERRSKSRPVLPFGTAVPIHPKFVHRSSSGSKASGANHESRRCVVGLDRASSAAALAQQADPIPVLTAELRAHAPANWEVRVRWRDGQLLASVTPWPYQA